MKRFISKGLEEWLGCNIMADFREQCFSDVANLIIVEFNRVYICIYR